MERCFSLIVEGNLIEFAKCILYININIRDNKMNSLLHYAVKFNQFDIANLLLEKNIDVNITDKNGDSALHIASLFNKSNFIRLLLKYKANINLRNKKNQTPIFYACKKGDMDLVKLLIENKADILVEDIEDENLLFNAVRSSNIVLIDFLINHTQLKLNSINYKKESLLHIAVQSNNYNVCDYLLKNKLKVYLLDTNLESALFKAIKYSDLEVIKLLLYYGAVFHQENKEGISCINYALLTDKFIIFDYFNQYELNSKYTIYRENFPIHLMLKERNEIKAIEYLQGYSNYQTVDSFGYHIKEIAKDLNLKHFLEEFCTKEKNKKSLSY